MVDIVLTAPNYQDKIVNEDGEMTAFFADYISILTELVNVNSAPLIGAGTPEGVIVALKFRWYVDTSAPVGEGLYLKESGNGDTGWVKRS